MIQNLFAFPDGIGYMIAILVGLAIVAQIVYLFLPDDCDPVDEIREGRKKR